MPGTYEKRSVYHLLTMIRFPLDRVWLFISFLTIGVNATLVNAPYGSRYAPADHCLSHYQIKTPKEVESKFVGDSTLEGAHLPLTFLVSADAFFL